MSELIIYYLSVIARSLGRLSIILFIVYINALPLVKSFSYQFDSKYLQCEVLGEEDLVEKEIITEKSEKKEGNSIDFIKSQLAFIGHFVSEFNPDIQIPPPKYS
jgi:hypothetical protein